MALTINNKGLNERLNNALSKAQEEEESATERLATGQIFTSQDPKPLEKSISDSMEYKLRSLSASKQNIASATSLLQISDGAMNEISNIVLRMRELNVTATNTTMGDQERKYIFLEYEALRDEVERIALTTEYNGIPLLYGKDSHTPQDLMFRIGDVQSEGNRDDEGNDINVIKISDFKSRDFSPDALGLKSAKDVLTDADDGTGVSLESARSMMESNDMDRFPTSYDQALSSVSDQRMALGAIQSRLHLAKNYTDVYQENLAAAKSRIVDTDYASETASLVQAKITSQASTALLSQNQVHSQLILQLLSRF
ncbi:MAG: flagellin [Oligoflexales bacterium]|nr:flagellin [Oligoflexales bacterium]